MGCWGVYVWCVHGVWGVYVWYMYGCMSCVHVTTRPTQSLLSLPMVWGATHALLPWEFLGTEGDSSLAEELRAQTTRLLPPQRYLEENTWC